MLSVVARPDQTACILSLMRSKFYNRIVGGKQLGDSQAIPTVPILDRL